MVGNTTATIYQEDGVTINICHDWAYFEVFGLTDKEFNKLSRFYYNLDKQKEITTMAKKIILIINIISIILIAWFSISFIEVIMKNSSVNPTYFPWNFFVLFFK